MAGPSSLLEPPLAETTIAILLGASEYPRKQVWSNPVLGTSARAVRDYLRSRTGLGMRPEQILDLFETEGGPQDQLFQIEDFLNSTGVGARDLIVYYVGHGCFDHDDYCLGIRATQRDREFLSTIESKKLARIIREGFARKRVYVILDSCFAASAARDFQSNEIEHAVKKMSQPLPRHGTAFLAAASRFDVTRAPRDERYTVFTGAVLDALTGGVERAQPRISLLELYEEVRERLQRRVSDEEARPELHVPSQKDGDVSRLELFPNPAYQRIVEARARAEAEARGVRNEDTRDRPRWLLEEEAMAARTRVAEAAAREFHPDWGERLHEEATGQQPRLQPQSQSPAPHPWPRRPTPRLPIDAEVPPGLVSSWALQASARVVQTSLPTPEPMHLRGLALTSTDVLRPLDPSPPWTPTPSRELGLRLKPRRAWVVIGVAGTALTVALIVVRVLGDGPPSIEARELGGSPPSFEALDAAVGSSTTWLEIPDAQNVGPPAMRRSAGSNTEPAATPTAPKNACDTMNVDDLMSQAENQYRAGYPKPALALLIKVLPCKQDIRTYRFAVMYACDGKDAAAAKQYFPKVPAQFRASLEQKCQQQGITVGP